MRCRPLVCIVTVSVALAGLARAADPPPGAVDEIDKKFPLGDELRVLAEDAFSPEYRKLVDRMLITDLAAEWQRVETRDSAEGFLEKHGGREKVLADADLKRAYERRLKIREAFLDVMRAGFKRFNQPAPFDKGAKAEAAGTVAGAGGIAAVKLSVVYPAPDAENHWPRFRGPDGQGTSVRGPLPLEWSKDKNILWHTPLPGRGHSSPVIWGDAIFLTSAAADGSERALHRLARADGRIVWTNRLAAHEPEKGVRDKNSFASGTPATDGERIVAFFGSGGLAGWDFEGNLLWHHKLPPIDTTHGTGASPLIYRDLVIFVHDQNRAASIFLALDKHTGEIVWEGKRPAAMGWSTPIVVRAGEREELVYAGGERIDGYDPLTGKTLWTMAGPTREVIPTIVVGGDLLYCASGRNGPTIAFRPGGSGDVTSTHTAWSAVRGGPHVPSPILVGGRLYTVNDTGIATCLDAKTGKLVWQARIRDLFSASPIAADGLLYFCGESGQTYVIRAADKFEIVATNDLGSPILASPAAHGGKLYIRTEEGLYCVGKE
jgi:outer membrane protein assembly factor BamB